MAWLPLHDSDAVRAGDVRAADVGDLELVVWRGASGEVVVMDARCPHQWSHLEAEGVVDGDEIVCAAHFWRFDGAGCGTKLNMLGRRDPKADIRVYPSREHEGRIEAMLEPDSPEAVPEPPVSRTAVEVQAPDGGAEGAR